MASIHFKPSVIPMRNDRESTLRVISPMFGKSCGELEALAVNEGSDDGGPKRENMIRSCQRKTIQYPHLFSYINYLSLRYPQNGRDAWLLKM